MILDKLALLKLEVKENIYKEKNKLAAIKTIQDLFSQIDFNAEMVPMNDIKKLNKLLVSLKGKTLNEEEGKLLKKLIK